MAKSVAELEQEARHLTARDRALLAQHLIASIDPGMDDGDRIHDRLDKD